LGEFEGENTMCRCKKGGLVSREQALRVHGGRKTSLKRREGGLFWNSRGETSLGAVHTCRPGKVGYFPSEWRREIGVSHRKCESGEVNRLSYQVL